MSSFPLILKPFGETAILLEWPKEVNEAILEDILGFQEILKLKLDETWVYVPSYNSLTLISQRGTFDFPRLREQILDWFSNTKRNLVLERCLWKLPVCYNEEFGPDLKETAEKLMVSIDELIGGHTAQEYTVYGIGFLPGFMYLGGLPQNLETKRRETPRLHVAKGSVGLAGKQTGIYPQDSPGGWNIIGRCPVPMFNLNLKYPCFVEVFDKIQFVPIDRATYDLRIIEAEVGIYQPEKIVLDA